MSSRLRIASQNLTLRRIGRGSTALLMYEMTSSTTTRKRTRRHLKAVISDAFVCIRNFMTAELKEDPLASLGDETWEAMLKISEVYEAERSECEEILSKVDWKSDTLKDGVLDLT